MHPPPRIIASRCAWLRGLIGLTFLSTLTLAALGANFYVSPSGNDGAPGTFAEPFATLQHAAEIAQPGDTVYLRSGTYRQQVEYATSPAAGHSGTPGNEITMKPFQEEDVTISGFDLVLPGQDGVGTWTQHTPNIWKIPLTASWARSAGKNTVMIDGIVQQEARWPNVPDAFNFDYRDMAFNESSSVDPNSAGPQPPYAGNDFYTATYVDHELPIFPDGTWTGAMIDLAPGTAARHGSGIVTGSTGTNLQFRYQKDEIFEVGDEDSYYLWNNLAALDQPGEAFFDVEGVSGPAYTLYIWSSEGDPSLHHQVEILRRSEAIVVGNASHLRFENLTVLGGRINCKKTSSFITFEGITARYGGAGLNLFHSVRAVVALDGTDSAIRDSYIGPSFGGGVQARNLNNVVENNVIRRCKEFGVGTWGGHNIIVNRNTVAESGRTNIAMFSTASQFNHNHCYLAGMRLPDEASMNSNGGDVDRLDTEVAYNWIHHNVGRHYAAKQMSGGRGIRLDGGGGGVYNMLIHHNIIWSIKGGPCLDLWTLPATSASYGDSRTRAYNNSVDGEIKFQGNGSMGGHDIRNNIGERLVLVGHGQSSSILRNNLLFNQGANAALWPGNIFGTPEFVSGTTANFYLQVTSDGIDAGETIPPVTDGFSGPAPELGALEYVGPDARVWSAGAIILPSDIPQLTIEVEVTALGEREIHVRNIPEGRVLPDEFALKLGNVVTHHVAYAYSVGDHQATAIIKFLTTPPTEGSQPVAVSTDAGTTWIPMGNIQVPPPGVSVTPPSSLLRSTTAGGAPATLEINGDLSKERLIPVDILRSLTDDLIQKPVPLVVDTRPLIDSGEMNPDGSNIRFRTADRSVELDYWIESGLDSQSTLFWIRHKPGATPNDDQIYLSVEDPTSLPVSDKTVLTDYYSVLNDPSLCVWYSANALAGQQNQGVGISHLPDQGARGHHAEQATPSLQPYWNEDRVGGLPTLRFDGNDHLFAGTVSPITPSKTSMVVVHRNEINSDDLGRTWSAGTGIAGSESTWGASGPTEDVFIKRANRRDAGALVNLTLGKKATKQNHFFTGDFAELLLFDVELANPGPFELLKDFASRKYALNNEARGQLRLQDTIEPTTLFVDGQEVPDFSILPDGSVQFTIPPAPSGSSLPALTDINIVTGTETISLPNALAYFEPNYDNWAAPLVGAGLGDPTLDVDGDLMVNLFEYLCDLDPMKAELMPFQVVGGTGPGGEDIVHFYLRRSTSATDALLFIEKTTDLQTWVALTPEDLGFAVYDADPDGDRSAVLYRAELPLPQSGLEAYRLKAELLSP